jgi:hypothetical protein
MHFVVEWHKIAYSTMKCMVDLSVDSGGQHFPPAMLRAQGTGHGRFLLWVQPKVRFFYFSQETQLIDFSWAVKKQRLAAGQAVENAAYGDGVYSCSRDCSTK